MEFEVTEAKTVEDGLHTGKITRCEIRPVEGHDYKYIDVYILEDETKVELKYGCGLGENDKISSAGKLGILLAQVTKVSGGAKLDPVKLLVGKNVRFLTQNKPGKKGGIFADVVDGSVKVQ